MSARLTILQPGLQTSVQDLGRTGFQAFGVPVCGALDPLALRIANRLVGNDENAAALECRLAGPGFKVEQGPLRLAVAGANVSIEIEHAGEIQRHSGWRAIDVPQGACVRIGPLRESGCAILALAGGVDVPEVLGSRATDMKGGFGGMEGRPLRAGDCLTTGAAPIIGPCLELPILPSLAFSGTLRIVPGPQQDAFTEAALESFFGQDYRVSREMDRMGMRLEGPALSFRRGADIVSDGIATGSIQVPGSGLPILLLADHQSVGGYAKIATLASVDLPAAGRLLPGARIRFKAVNVAEAEEARHEQERDIIRLLSSLAPVHESARIDEAALLTGNLISGVVNALAVE